MTGQSIAYAVKPAAYPVAEVSDVQIEPFFKLICLPGHLIIERVDPCLYIVAETVHAFTHIPVKRLIL